VATGNTESALVAFVPVDCNNIPFHICSDLAFLEKPFVGFTLQTYGMSHPRNVTYVTSEDFFLKISM